MFKIVKERLSWWPVIVSVPAEDGGTSADVKFDLQFRITTVDEMAKMVNEASAVAQSMRSDDEDAESNTVSATMAKLFGPFVANWRGVGDEGGSTLPYTDDALRQLFDVPGAFAASLSSFNDCAQGLPKARRKN